MAILIAGALLRLLLVLAWKPAFFGWPDAASYIGVSQSGDFFRNELRPAGYPIVLRAMNEISPTLLFVVIVHHLLGLASAAIMYFTVARTGISRWLALLPAAVMALAAPVFFMEHSANSEAVFVFSHVGGAVLRRPHHRGHQPVVAGPGRAGARHRGQRARGGAADPYPRRCLAAVRRARGAVAPARRR